MKWFVLILVLGVNVAFGQVDSCSFRIDSLTKDTIYIVVDKSPSLGETKKETLEYILKHFKYPHHYKGNELLIASFIVQEDGTINQLEIIKKSANDIANKSLIEMIESMPKWKPGYCKGKAVKTETKLPIKLKLK